MTHGMNLVKAKSRQCPFRFCSHLCRSSRNSRSRRRPIGNHKLLRQLICLCLLLKCLLKVWILMLRCNSPRLTRSTSTSQKSCSLKSSKYRTNSLTLNRLPRLKQTARVEMKTLKLLRACLKMKTPPLLKRCSIRKSRCRCSSQG